MAEQTLYDIKYESIEDFVRTREAELMRLTPDAPPPTDIDPVMDVPKDPLHLPPHKRVERQHNEIIPTKQGNYIFVEDPETGKKSYDLLKEDDKISPDMVKGTSPSAVGPFKGLMQYVGGAHLRSQYGMWRGLLKEGEAYSDAWDKTLEDLSKSERNPVNFVVGNLNPDDEMAKDNFYDNHRDSNGEEHPTKQAAERLIKEYRTMLVMSQHAPNSAEAKQLEDSYIKNISEVLGTEVKVREGITFYNAETSEGGVRNWVPVDVYPTTKREYQLGAGQLAAELLTDVAAIALGKAMYLAGAPKLKVPGFLATVGAGAALAGKDSVIALATAWLETMEAFNKKHITNDQRVNYMLKMMRETALSSTIALTGFGILAHIFGDKRISAKASALLEGADNEQLELYLAAARDIEKNIGTKPTFIEVASYMQSTHPDMISEDSLYTMVEIMKTVLNEASRINKLVPRVGEIIAQSRMTRQLALEKTEKEFNVRLNPDMTEDWDLDTIDAAYLMLSNVVKGEQQAFVDRMALLISEARDTYENAIISQFKGKPFNSTNFVDSLVVGLDKSRKYVIKAAGKDYDVHMQVILEAMRQAHGGSIFLQGTDVAEVFARHVNFSKDAVAEGIAKDFNIFPRPTRSKMEHLADEDSPQLKAYNETTEEDEPIKVTWESLSRAYTGVNRRLAKERKPDGNPDEIASLSAMKDAIEELQDLFVRTHVKSEGGVDDVLNTIQALRQRYKTVMDVVDGTHFAKLTQVMGNRVNAFGNAQYLFKSGEALGEITDKSPEVVRSIQSILGEYRKYKKETTLTSKEGEYYDIGEGTEQIEKDLRTAFLFGLQQMLPHRIDSVADFQEAARLILKTHGDALSDLFKIEKGAGLDAQIKRLTEEYTEFVKKPLRSVEELLADQKLLGPFPKLADAIEAGDIDSIYKFISDPKNTRTVEGAIRVLKEMDATSFPPTNYITQLKRVYGYQMSQNIFPKSFKNKGRVGFNYREYRDYLDEFYGIKGESKYYVIEALYGKEALEEHTKVVDMLTSIIDPRITEAQRTSLKEILERGESKRVMIVTRGEGARHIPTRTPQDMHNLLKIYFRPLTKRGIAFHATWGIDHRMQLQNLLKIISDPTQAVEWAKKANNYYNLSNVLRRQFLYRTFGATGGTDRLYAFLQEPEQAGVDYRYNMLQSMVKDVSDLYN